jgi:hypothetical protein
MKINLGAADRVIRVVLAIIIMVLYFTHVISGSLALVLLLVVGVLIVTSFLGFCPIYLLFGISNKKKQRTKIGFLHQIKSGFH